VWECLDSFHADDIFFIRLLSSKMKFTVKLIYYSYEALTISFYCFILCWQAMLTSSSRVCSFTCCYCLCVCVCSCLVNWNYYLTQWARAMKLFISVVKVYHSPRDIPSRIFRDVNLKSKVKRRQGEWQIDFTSPRVRVWVNEWEIKFATNIKRHMESKGMCTYLNMKRT
jgi:hypothetical protein